MTLHPISGSYYNWSNSLVIEKARSFLALLAKEKHSSERQEEFLSVFEKLVKT